MKIKVSILVFALFANTIFLSCSKDESSSSTASVNSMLSGDWEVTSYHVTGFEESMGNTYEKLILSFENTTETTGNHVWDLLYTDGFTNKHFFNYTIFGGGDSLNINGPFEYNFLMILSEDKLTLKGKSGGILPLQTELTIQAEK